MISHWVNAKHFVDQHWHDRHWVETIVAAPPAGTDACVEAVDVYVVGAEATGVLASVVVAADVLTVELEASQGNCHA